MPGHSERHSFAGSGRSGPGRAGPAGAGAMLGARGVLADRMAAALVHHEPGWRLPRHSALARRYNVSTAEVDAAIQELAARRLIRRLPDGQAYRASPAEYLIPLEGIPGLAAHLDPMGGEISCRSRQISLRRVPEDISWALGVSPADPVCVIRFLWTADGQPAAFATTYLIRQAAEPYLSQSPGAPLDQDHLDQDHLDRDHGASGLGPSGQDMTAVPDGVGEDDPFGDLAPGVPDGLSAPRDGQGGQPPFSLLPLAGPARADAAWYGPGEAGQLAAGQPAAGKPGALFVEMQPPPPSVARSLRLTPGQLAAMMTIRFDDPDSGSPLALTVAICRPDLFRIVVSSADPPAANGNPGSFAGIWTHTVRDWKP